jgi:hypothetical protein
LETTKIIAEKNVLLLKRVVVDPWDIDIYFCQEKNGLG